jgi:hypothetical protein
MAATPAKAAFAELPPFLEDRWPNLWSNPNLERMSTRDERGTFTLRHVPPILGEGPARLHDAVDTFLRNNAGEATNEGVFAKVIYQPRNETLVSNDCFLGRGGCPGGLVLSPPLAFFHDFPCVCLPRRSLVEWQALQRRVSSEAHLVLLFTTTTAFSESVNLEIGRPRATNRRREAIRSNRLIAWYDHAGSYAQDDLHKNAQMLDIVKVPCTRTGHDLCLGEGGLDTFTGMTTKRRWSEHTMALEERERETEREGERKRQKGTNPRRIVYWY